MQWSLLIFVSEYFPSQELNAAANPNSKNRNITTPDFKNKTRVKGKNVLICCWFCP